MAQSRSPPPLPTADASSEMRKKQNQEDEQEQEQQPLGSLPEDALVEILSRVPYSSLCRFKCVSKPWLALCSAPDIRKRSPQTLSGFFYKHHGDFSFRNLSGRGSPMVDPSMPFLRKSYDIVIPRHCCAGLVLCRCWKLPHFDTDEYSLVVCNPATEKWTELPPTPIELSDEARKYLGLPPSPIEARQYLGFDPADPSRFVVFAHRWEFKEVAIYSSNTGQWTVVQSGWIDGTLPVAPCVFLNGTMHFMTAKSTLVTVDTEGKVWREIDIPGNVGYANSSIGQSQGRLYAWYIDNPNICQLSVCTLEYYDSAKWTLKHTVNILELFGRHSRQEDDSDAVFAIHPDRNLIFLTDGKEKTISYDMDNREVHVICTSKKLRDAQPYIPFFAEWPSHGH